MMLFRSRSDGSIVSAIQFTGINHYKCKSFINDKCDPTLGYPNIVTPVGTMAVHVTDWLIKTDEGVVFPYTDPVFSNLFTPVDTGYG